MQKTNDKDLIVKILTQSHISTLYRFYGTRHSIINIGRKIDFEEVPQLGFLPKLKNILHLSHKWEMDYERVFIWQHFIRLLSKHLSDIYALDSFYFELLEWGSGQILAQNPKRVVLEMYAKLLSFEGRAHREPNPICFVCQEQILGELSLGRAFLFAHKSCIGGVGVKKQSILSLLDTQSSILLEDSEVAILWEILGFGL